jgi:hypothetical protein
MKYQQGRWIVDNSASKKSTIGCFGAPREKEGKIGRRSPENAGQVDLGFWTPRVLVSRVLTPRFRPKVVSE